MAFDQVKMLQQLRKAQKQLGKEIIEVEAGDGAVIVQITGELKIKSIKIDPDMVDLGNIEELEQQSIEHSKQVSLTAIVIVRAKLCRTRWHCTTPACIWQYS